MDKIIINFETKLGLNPEYLDSNTFNGVTILPMNFNETDQHFHLQIIVERNWNSIENIQMELLDVNGDKTIF